jgi:hypothetical protein
MKTKMSDCKRGSATSCGWFIALLLSALLAGCGGGGGGREGPGSGDAAAAAAAAAGRPLTVLPGGGTGAGGAGTGPAPVGLGLAGNYVILAKTGISTSSGTAVTGDLGISPGAASLITGFGLIADSSNDFWTSSLVTGKVFAADNAGAGGTPIKLTTATTNMTTAFTDAAGRAPDYTELGAGAIGGMSTGVSIPTEVFLAGGPNDVWIFQIAGDITMASAQKVTLIGGALAKNIFWQVGGPTGVAIGTTAHFEGIILAAKAITLNTGASVNGRLLAQTAVTLKSNTVVQPAP